jgi:hypothetical protein
MNTDRHRTITVHFGPDSAADVSVHYLDGDAIAQKAPYPSDRASLDAEQGQKLLFRAIANPELVEQLRALVRGDFSITDLAEVDMGRALRCSGGRVYEL